ncbi:unnamed protein product [Rhizophagus irregularis]|uniref:Uncharacterized protein n=1 Tax=Rhizophagus irregularis TaxID=588596 RepID=A0A916EIM3_9GLOM|nr:unnamed protein product [Rhizophagus irregularis]
MSSEIIICFRRSDLWTLAKLIIKLFIGIKYKNVTYIYEFYPQNVHWAESLKLFNGLEIIHNIIFIALVWSNS